MNVGLTVTLSEINAELWARRNNVPWPTHDRRAGATRVRQDVKGRIQQLLAGDALFQELGIKVEVK